MSRPASFGVVCILGVVAGCAAHRPAAVQSKAAPLAPQGPVIVMLKGQHQIVMVTAGPDGPLYTAQTSDGRTIVANASLAQLRAENPEIYHFIEPAMAADASVDGSGAAVGSRAKIGAAQSGPLMLDSAR